MNIKAPAALLIGAILLASGASLAALPQSATKAAPRDTAKAAPPAAPAQAAPPQGGAAGAEGATKAAPKASEPLPFSYSSGGRRDPFKDLLGGQEVREKRVITGFADLLLDEIKIMGIVAMKAERVAIIALPEGFPVSVHEGDRFAEGYILSIGDGQVILRKTRDRGMPLQKPRDIVKEITPEERQDE